jgi:hypothetical protein
MDHIELKIVRVAMRAGAQTHCNNVSIIFCFWSPSSDKYEQIAA